MINSYLDADDVLKCAEHKDRGSCYKLSEKYEREGSLIMGHIIKSHRILREIRSPSSLK